MELGDKLCLTGFCSNIIKQFIQHGRFENILEDQKLALETKFRCSVHRWILKFNIFVTFGSNALNVIFEVRFYLA